MKSAPVAGAGRSRTLGLSGSAAVERFHSVRKLLSYDDSTTNVCSGIAADDFETYSNWSLTRPLSYVHDVTVSDEDISNTEHWVRHPPPIELRSN